MCLSNATKHSGNDDETGNENRQNVQQPDTDTFDDVEELVDYVEEVVEEMLEPINIKFNQLTRNLQTVERKVEEMAKVFTMSLE